MAYVRTCSLSWLPLHELLTNPPFTSTTCSNEPQPYHGEMNYATWEHHIHNTFSNVRIALRLAGTSSYCPLLLSSPFLPLHSSSPSCSLNLLSASPLSRLLPRGLQCMSHPQRDLNWSRKGEKWVPKGLTLSTTKLHTYIRTYMADFEAICGFWSW